jgi:hypothetical protein
MADGPPQKKRKAKTDERQKPKFRFIQHDLSKSEKEHLWGMDAEAEFPIDRVLELVAEGYSVKISHDEYHHCFTASFTDASAGSPFENSCLTGRGSSPVDAWHAVAFRHFHLAAEDWAYFVLDDITDRGSAW